jgi:hypothetical protein
MVVAQRTARHLLINTVYVQLAIQFALQTTMLFIKHLA